MRELLELFYAFAKTGLFTFGGGYAMLPLLQREIVDNRGWATSEELADYYAIGQCTPGIIAVNTATFVGYRRKGIPGAIFATLGLVFPSIVIITVIAAFISNFTEIEWVRHALAGIRVCVCVLVLNSVIKLARNALVDVATGIIFAAVAVLALFTDISSFVWVICAGAAGIIIRTVMESVRAHKKKG